MGIPGSWWSLYWKQRRRKPSQEELLEKRNELVDNDYQRIQVSGKGKRQISVMDPTISPL